MKGAVVLSIATFIFSWRFYVPYSEYKRVNDELELSKNPIMWLTEIQIVDTDDLAHKSPRILFKVENAGPSTAYEVTGGTKTQVSKERLTGYPTQIELSKSFGQTPIPPQKNITGNRFLSKISAQDWDDVVNRRQLLYFFGRISFKKGRKETKAQDYYFCRVYDPAFKEFVLTSFGNGDIE